VCAILRPALTTQEIHWRATEIPQDADDSPPRRTFETVLTIPTTEGPYHLLAIGSLTGGRRLLSDDCAMLDAVALMAARRIDALRVTHERCEQTLREQNIRTLAVQAELHALQAQLNPHFLFNALTTIGYLIASAPARALETLLQLTALLRAVLQHSADHLATLGEELEIAEAHLAIERARFEERLAVTVDVPAELRRFTLPSLVVQPLVENAIKHAIAANRQGGAVSITAYLARDDDGRTTLRVAVRDTGAGPRRSDLRPAPGAGLGLSLVERRLACHYGSDAILTIRPLPGGGTEAELVVPALTRHRIPAPPRERSFA